MRAFGVHRKILLPLLLLFGVCSAAAAEGNKRVALIIANAHYQHTKALNNPENDAKQIAAKLIQLQFDVRVELNLDAKGFAHAVQVFASKLDKNTDALFYYAGHGLQYQGENYLVSIDAKLESEATLQFETYRLNTIIGLMENKAGTTLIFWDGCRNNPLADGLFANRTVSISDPSAAVRGGSAPISPRRGDTLVVYSAEPGKFALDGPGDFSPFADSLSTHITTPALEVETMLKRVTADVEDKTKSYQRPQRLSQLTKEFYFAPGAAQLEYQAELESLRAQVAKLTAPSAEQHLAIVSAGDQTTQLPKVRSAISDTITETPTPNQTKNAPQPSISGPEPGSAETDVIVSGNTSELTIIRKLRVAPNSKLLALGGDDGLIRILNLDNFEIIKTINAHAGRVSDIDFSPDSKTLVSAGRDGFIRFWDVTTGRKSREDLRAENSIPYSVRLNPILPDRYVLVGDKDGRLLAWDLHKGARLITNEKLHSGPVLSVAYQPRGKGIYLSAGGDGFLRFRLPEGQRVGFHAHKGPIFDAGYDADGTVIYSAGTDREIKVWDASHPESDHPKAILSGHLKYVLSTKISSNGKILISGGGDKSINIWNFETDKLAGRLVGHTSDVESLAFTPNNRFIISASEDKSVRIWSVDEQKELVRIFFGENSDKIAGVTYDNQSFGDRDTGLLSTFIGGRAVGPIEAARAVQYVGHGISIVERETIKH
jgi:WD40 repeat protein/uncharacterized caspase-like protein